MGRMITKKWRSRNHGSMLFGFPNLRQVWAGSGCGLRQQILSQGGEPWECQLLPPSGAQGPQSRDQSCPFLSSLWFWSTASSMGPRRPEALGFPWFLPWFQPADTAERLIFGRDPAAGAGRSASAQGWLTLLDKGWLQVTPTKSWGRNLGAVPGRSYMWSYNNNFSDLSFSVFSFGPWHGMWDLSFWMEPTPPLHWSVES